MLLRFRNSGPKKSRRQIIYTKYYTCGAVHSHASDHQRYSTENQADAIYQYAERRGMSIVKTYSDADRSGLSFGGRDALKTLIDDVQK